MLNRTLPLLVIAAVLVSAAPASTTPAHPLRSADWPGWQKDLSGTRHNAAEWRVNRHTVGGLKLKWAFAYPPSEGKLVRSQPAVVGDTVYFGGPDGKFYARDARTGADRWTFDLTAVDPAPPGTIIFNTDSPSIAGGKIYFGDNRAYLYAVDQRTGRLSWATRMDTNTRGSATGSPIVHDGKVFIGISSGETAMPRDYACCTFRGHVDAYDANTGALAWRHYTVPEPKEAGTWPNGAKRFEPSGAGVWGSPVIDPRDHTLYVGTGQNYSGRGGEFDSMLALDTRSGAVKWTNQVTDADTWRWACTEPSPEGFCTGLTDGTHLDYDIGTGPNLFTAGGRKLVGAGQKSGVYHVFDARTGQVVWRRQLGVAVPNGGQSGIQWGSSYDGKRLYIATFNAKPGTLFAVDPLTGKVLWATPNPADGCTTGGAAGQPDCALAHGAPVSSTPGVVYLGSSDGKVRAYAADTGKVLWTYDTVQDVRGVNGVMGRGNVVGGPGGGVVVSRGMVFVQSGYRGNFNSPHSRVLLAFAP
ncbi:PQQ-binding-like beta-propeller repeat protein [Lentzea tibetensis]|uniref:PQQ-binding-like beta-propeller repeat protein n=1 Tax=Lentzea tibetensis TaxID=2591470 RepID=A0A563ELI8_9PSEU|nr:PQQ-binding-like beta-propeller repeat protein [Lentzea tibetensis]TWP48102.1 PQQ-binding-like beta-propeller repeat protein [Lentzea tibetensis]